MRHESSRAQRKGSMRLLHAFLITMAAMAATACAPTAGEADDRLASAAQPVQIACSDPQGCPDLISSPWFLKAALTLDTRQFKPSSCAVHEYAIKPGKRRLLRMNVSIANVGAGALIVGGPGEHPELFDFDDCHNH